MTKRQLLVVLGLLFFFIGMGVNASDEEHKGDTGLAIFFFILSVPMFIGAWRVKDDK